MKIDEIGQNIKRYRKEKHMTQKEVAARLFMEERNYAKIERGEKKTLCVTTLISIAEVFNISPLDLITNEKKTEQQNEQNDEEAMNPKAFFSKINSLQKELTAIKASQQNLEAKLEKLI